MMKSKLATYIINTLLGIFFLIFFISLGLVIAIYCRPLYYIHMDKLSVVTGYNTEEIKANYDALIDYCSPFYNGTLKLPSLPSSQSGLKHFEEVKIIFNVFFALQFISLGLIAILIYIQRKRKVSSYLLTSSIIMCVAPIIVGTLCAIDFESTFILFHQIVFDNESWYFDPVTDPIILLLPESFFLQCAVILIISVVFGCLLLLALHFHKQNKLKD